ncbi:MAG: 30S ribosomal protein S7, partial [Pseudomonadota bacterium]
MSRRHRAEKREVLPDAKFGDRILTKFMNNLMYDGKKSAAEGIVYGALGRVEGRLKREPIEVVHEALDNIKPAVEVRSRRVGGATYQVPVEVRPERREALAIRWLIIAARARNENTMEERLAGELMDASQNRGNAVKKRE